MKPREALVPVNRVVQTILMIRGQKVMLGADLAPLYGLPTKRLNEQVRRNRDRFPDDFMFRLTAKEKAEVVANCDHLQALKFSATLPLAFTEHGALMLASVLNSPKAVEMSIYVVRAFIRIREVLSTHKRFAQKLLELERRIAQHDEEVQAIVKALRELMRPPPLKPKRPIGFRIDDQKARCHAIGTRS